MKKLKFAFLLLFFTILNYSSLPQTQEKFIIGADWLNSTNRDWFLDDLEYLSEEYWDTISSFGLNYGMLTYNENAEPNGEVFINSELDKALNRGITIFLHNWRLWATRGRRWVYQVEDTDLDTYDYNQHSGGRSLIDPDADIHWTEIHNNNVPNYWELDNSLYSSGFIAFDLKEGLDTEIPDHMFPTEYPYYVKIRAKVPQGTPSGTNIVFRIIVKNKDTGLTKTADVRRNQLTTSWQEIYVLNFRKTPTGPEYVKAGEEFISNVVLNDSIGILGVEDYEYLVDPTYTPYDFIIYWFDNYNCDFDYLSVEDWNSYRLHDHQLDNIIIETVENYMMNDGLGNIKIQEEPNEDWLYPIRFVSDMIDDVFEQNQLEIKSALTFHGWGSSSQSYLGKTLLKEHLCHTYPIATAVIEPENSQSYLNSIQNVFNNPLISRFEEQIFHSQRFNKPYWFTTQAHSWSYLREPSAYEIRAMANLAVCYGATGIYYFMYAVPYINMDPTQGTSGVTLLDEDHPNDPGHLIPRFIDNYGYLKWEIIKGLNHHLSTIGSELLDLKWNEGVYITGSTQPQDKYITTVESVQDDPANTHIQLSFFNLAEDPNNENLEHFFVVNRRTYIDDERDIKITIDKSESVFNNWIIKEVGTSNSWTVYKTGYFKTSYEPGEGKLFRLEPVMIAGGDLLFDETLPPDLVLGINGTGTVSNGVTLTINEGCHLTFYSSKALFVEGNLIVNGTESNQVVFDFILQDLYNSQGIYLFNNSGTIIIEQANIKNSHYGIKSDKAFFELKYSKINNCYMGVFVEQAKPKILYCDFTDCKWGIRSHNDNFATGLDAEMLNNNISYTDNQSISFGYYLNYSSPDIRNNLITDYYYGLHCSNFSSPEMGQQYKLGENDINNIGLTSYNSSPFLGALYTGGPPNGGYNGLYNNLLKNASATSNSIIQAYKTWWGTAIESEIIAMLNIDATSNIIYDQWLTSSPFSSSPLPQNKESEFENLEIEVNNSEAFGPGSTILERLMAAFAISQRNRQLGRQILQEIINSNISSQFAPFGMNLLWRTFYDDDPSDFITFLSQLSNNPNRESLRGMAKLILIRYESSNPIPLLDSLITTFNDSLISLSAKYDKFIYAYFDLEDLDLANDFTQELVNDFPNSVYTQDALLLMGQGNSLVKSQNLNGVLNLVYQLYQNYPNPFNPTTTIEYSIPEASFVELKIYDILGGEVATLVKENKLSGNHSVKFNASNLPSGIYFYRIVSGKFTATKKLILLK